MSKWTRNKLKNLNKKRHKNRNKASQPFSNIRELGEDDLGLLGPGNKSTIAFADAMFDTSNGASRRNPWGTFIDAAIKKSRSIFSNTNANKVVNTVKNINPKTIKDAFDQGARRTGGELLKFGVPAVIGYGIHSAANADIIQDYYHSRYGDNEESNRSIAAIRSMGTTAGVASTIPSLYLSSKFTKGLRGVVPKNFSVESSKFIGPKLPKTPKESKSEPGWMQRTVAKIPSIPRGHPVKTSFIAGSAVGLGTGLAQGMTAPASRSGKEGNIQGITSYRDGGISPELQFSTQGLGLAIHNKRKKRVI